MEKVILVSREPSDHEQLITMVESLFPECTIEIVSGTEGRLPILRAPVDNRKQRTPSLPWPRRG